MDDGFVTVWSGKSILIEARSGAHQPEFIPFYEYMDEAASDMEDQALKAFAKSLGIPLWYVTGDIEDAMRHLDERDRAWNLMARRRHKRGHR